MTLVRSISSVLRLAILIAASAPLAGFAASDCIEQPLSAEPGSDRHFVVFAGRSAVFFDGSGPTFVMLMRLGASAQESEIGAVGIYADTDAQPLFGSVPVAGYNEFLQESEEADDVMLRLEIDDSHYRRVLTVLRTWDRRAREKALLYPDISMDNILLVKQATEELNRCGQTLVLHDLDWGLDDDISENNQPLAIPHEYFRALRQLNESRHLPDAAMPAALLVAETDPLPPLPSEPERELAPAVRTAIPAHVHPTDSTAEHAHHAPAGTP